MVTSVNTWLRQLSSITLYSSGGADIVMESIALQIPPAESNRLIAIGRWNARRNLGTLCTLVS